MIEIETPHRWLIIELPGNHKKVFGVWMGGYLGSDAWKANSGIVKCDVEEEYILFHGMSGSIYKCSKKSYGTNGYGSSILRSIHEKQEIRVLSKEEAFEFYDIREDDHSSNLDK